jgi:hypothetical protein
MDSSMVMVLPGMLVGTPLAIFGAMLVLNLGGFGERMIRDAYSRRRLTYGLPPLPPGTLVREMVRRDVRFSRTLGLFFVAVGVSMTVVFPVLVHLWFGEGAGIGL